MVQVPEQLEWQFGNMQAFRHLVFVIDHVKNSVSFYLDGGLLAEKVFGTPGYVAELDCFDENSGASYRGLGHRPPGAYNFLGDMQDFRMYPRALTAQEVHDIAYDSTGIARRECSTSTEDGDAMFLDINGHTCEWYYEALVVQGRKQICSSPEVRAACPVACQAKDQCYEPVEVEPKVYQLWNRIMLLEKSAVPGLSDSEGSGYLPILKNSSLANSP
jgi:hypothetical protein